MRKQLIGFAVAVIAIAAVGCGGGSGAGNAYTCSFAASLGVCWEWTAPQSLTSQQQSQLQTMCGQANPAGSFSTGANCPATNRVGTCALNAQQLGGSTLKYRFYSPTYTAQVGQQICASIGTWTAG